MDDLDRNILTLLGADARMSVATLARRLKVARSTIQARLERLETSGIIAGYTGKGTKTIVPSEARVRMDFRLIPRISPKKAIAKLKQHLIDQGFGHIEVRAFDGAEPPYKISVKEDISQAIIAAATEVYGELPVVNGVSAEGAILRHVWVPCVLTGFANPGCNLHAPDEKIHVDKYIQGIKYAAAVMEHFGRS